MTFSDLKIFELSPEEREAERLYKACRVAAVSYAAGFKRSSGQVRARLQEEGFSEELIARVLPEMEAEGYTADREICRSLMRVRRGRKAESHLALAKRLSRYQIPKHIIEEELQAWPSDRELAFEYLDTLTDELPGLYHRADNPREKRRVLARIARKAAARGFSNDLALAWLRERAVSSEGYEMFFGV